MHSVYCCCESDLCTWKSRILNEDVICVVWYIAVSSEHVLPACLNCHLRKEPQLISFLHKCMYLINNTHHRKTFHPRWYSVLNFFLAKRGYIRCSTLCQILDSWRSIFSRIIYHSPPYNVYFEFWYYYENKIWNKLLPSIKILDG